MNLDNLAINALKSDDFDEIDDALRYLYEKYSKLVYLCIIGIVKDSRDAEELTDDTFLRLFDNRKKLSVTKNLKYYIITTAKHLALDFIRKRQVELVLDEEIILSSPAVIPKPLNELKEELLCYIQLEDVDIIIYHIVYNESFKEIAERFGKPTSTIKTRYFRAVGKLHSEMENDYE